MKQAKRTARLLPVTRWLTFCAALLVTAPAVAANDFERLYDHMIEANKAQVVMLHEEGLISEELAGLLATSLADVAREGAPPAEDRQYPNYLDLEAALAERIGEQASNIHLGRSRNDLGATMNLMLMRQQALDLVAVMTEVRSTVQAMAAQHVDTVMPGYTHGVQAQPTTLAHFLLAFDAGLHRDVERLRQAYARINRSPLGAGAFTTSGFALDRERLADLLGFPALVDNTYDAIVVNAMDTKLELATVMSISALNIGRLAQYILFQYDDPAPGLLLTDEFTGRSSIMPQKRNPSAVERLRMAASEVVGRAHTAALLAHSTPLYEVKDVRQDHTYRLNELVAHTIDMFNRLQQVLDALTIRPDLLRQKVDADYSTMTELADTLKREAGVPFRVGYKVASALTTYGRERGKAPAELRFEEVATVYRQVTGEELPLSNDQLQKVFDAGEFVKGRKGIGGPQPESVRLMLQAGQRQVREQVAWASGEAERIRDSAKALDKAFSKLVN